GLGRRAGTYLTSILPQRHIAYVVQAVLNVPVLADQAQEVTSGNLGTEAGEGVAHEVRRLAGPHAPHMGHAALPPQHLLGAHPAQLGEIVGEGGRGGELAHFVPLALRAMTARRREALAGRRLVKEQRHLREELRLIGLDHEEVVPLGLANLRAERMLAVERIPRHHSTPQRYPPQQVRGQTEFRLRFLRAHLVLTRRRRWPRGVPHPPFAPAPGRSARRKRRPNARRVIARHGCREVLYHQWRSPPHDRLGPPAPTAPVPLRRPPRRAL